MLLCPVLNKTETSENSTFIYSFIKLVGQQVTMVSVSSEPRINRSWTQMTKSTPYFRRAKETQSEIGTVLLPVTGCASAKLGSTARPRNRDRVFSTVRKGSQDTVSGLQRHRADGGTREPPKGHQTDDKLRDGKMDETAWQSGGAQQFSKPGMQGAGQRLLAGREGREPGRRGSKTSPSTRSLGWREKKNVLRHRYLHKHPMHTYT